MRPSAAEQDRTDLSIAFRLAERFGFHEGICNHLSVRLDGEAEHFLINPYGLHWSEIRPESLLLMNADGDVLEGAGEVESTARFIHVAGHRANARHKAIFHTHMPWATTLTMLDGDASELAMAHQTAMRFHGRIGYEPDFGGLAHDESEGERIAARATERPEVDVVFLGSHGVVVGAPSVALAFDELYYLERACRQQVLALQTGHPLRHVSDAIVEHTAAQTRDDLARYAEKHFRALARVLAASPDRAMTL